MADETVIESQLAKLQDALLEGRIDMTTYEKLKGDLLNAGATASTAERPTEATDSGRSQSDPPRAVKEPSSPWAKGNIYLRARGGTVSAVEETLEVYLDDELIASGSTIEGVRGEFQTSPGEHVLKVKSRKEFKTPLLKPTTTHHVYPMQLESPGMYRITLLRKNLVGTVQGFFKKGDISPYEVEIVRVQQY